MNRPRDPESGHKKPGHPGNAQNKVLSIVDSLGHLAPSDVENQSIGKVVDDLKEARHEIRHEETDDYVLKATSELEDIQHKAESLKDPTNPSSSLPIEDLHDLLTSIKAEIESLSRPLYPLVGSGAVLWNPTPQQQLLALYGQLHVLAARFKGLLPEKVRESLEELIGSIRSDLSQAPDWDDALRTHMSGLLDLFLLVNEASVGPEPDFIEALQALLEGTARAFWLHDIPSYDGPVTGHQEDPVVLGLEAGGWVTCWEDHSEEMSSCIRMEIYGEDGKPRSGIVQVAQSTAYHDMRPVITDLPGDRFVVAFEKDNGVQVEIYLQKFDIEGNPIDLPIRIAEPQGKDQEHPSIARMKDGSFVVAWQEHHFRQGAYTIRFQRFSSTGARAGTTRTLTVEMGDEARFPQLTSLGDGFAILHQVYQDGFLEALHCTMFDNEGSRLDMVEASEFSNEQEITQASVQGLTNGTFVIAWQELNDEGSGNQICCQQFANCGDELTDRMVLPSPNHGEPFAPKLCATPHSGFVLSWQVETSPGCELWVQRFDAECDPIGPLFEVASDIAGRAHRTGLAALPDGFISVWCTRDAGGRRLQIQQQRLSVCPLRAVSSRLSTVQQLFYEVISTLENLEIHSELPGQAQDTYDRLTQTFNLIQGTSFQDRYFRKLMGLYESIEDLRDKLAPYVVAKSTTTQKHRGLQLLRARLKGVLSLLIRHSENHHPDESKLGLRLLKQKSNYTNQLGRAMAENSGGSTSKMGRKLADQLYWYGRQYRSKQDVRTVKKPASPSKSSNIVKFDEQTQVYRPSTWRPKG